MNHPWPADTVVCIPSYKAADLLVELIPRVKEYVPPENILVVDDASGDATPVVCADHGVKCLRHYTNRGKGGALKTGFFHCCSIPAKWVITMDADGQHAPEDLPKFIAASRVTPSPGICIGARAMRPGTMPPERIFSNRLTSFILGLFAGIPVRDSQCGYRLYATALLNRVDIEYSRFEMESEIILKAAFLGFPVTFTGIQTLYLEGPSHIAHAADTFRWTVAVLRTRSQRRRIISTFRRQQQKETGQ